MQELEQNAFRPRSYLQEQAVCHRDSTFPHLSTRCTNRCVNSRPSASDNKDLLVCIFLVCVEGCFFFTCSQSGQRAGFVPEQRQVPSNCGEWRRDRTEAAQPGAANQANHILVRNRSQHIHQHTIIEHYNSIFGSLFTKAFPKVFDQKSNMLFKAFEPFCTNMLSVHLTLKTLKLLVRFIKHFKSHHALLHFSCENPNKTWPSLTLFSSAC